MSESDCNHLYDIPMIFMGSSSEEMDPKMLELNEVQAGAQKSRRFFGPKINASSLGTSQNKGCQK